jgi:translation initiation factor IF-2
MATKSKPATKKPVARKPTPAHHKPATAKGKVSKEPVKPHAKPGHISPPAKATHLAGAAKPAAPARAPVESVSLIDKKHPEKKIADGEAKKKTTVLPPISRIRASLETPTAPPPAPTSISTTDAAKVEEAQPEAEAPSQKIIHIKPPIVVKEFAGQLGLKPFQLIKELMDNFRQPEPNNRARHRDQGR